MHLKGSKLGSLYLVLTLQPKAFMQNETANENCLSRKAKSMKQSAIISL